jgi:hypothetical protein
MNADLTNTFKDARRLINSWKDTYSTTEYPQKVILNIFYRKYTIEKMWTRVINLTSPSWEKAYESNMLKYAEIAQNEIVPVLDNNLQADKKVTAIKYSDFQSYIKSASRGDIDSIKAIEYTYFLNRIFDEFTILWISMVNSGETKTNAIIKLTGAILPREMPIDTYAEIENIFDQIGVENYLQTLFMKEHTNQM